MASRDLRREKNQLRIRQAKKRLHDAVEDRVPESQPVPFLCEWADHDRVGTVEVQLREWEAFAAKPNHYLLEAGHERSQGEEVVGSVGEYDIAKKPD
jgi:hypothetical protein